MANNTQTPTVRKPRVWPAFTVGLTVPLVMIAAQMVLAVAVTAALLVRGASVDEAPHSLQACFLSPSGLVVVIAASQLAALAVVVVAARLSSEPAARRLGFVRGRLPFWGLPVLIVATFFVHSVAGVASVGLFGGMGEHLQALSDVFRGGSGVWAVALVLAASALPGVCEETVFRGYVQRRLALRLGPMAGVLLAAAMFAVAHLDPQHMLLAFILGVWLGVVAWYTKAVWPAIICHFSTNLVGVISARLGWGEESLGQVGALWWALLVVAAAAFVGALLLLHRLSNDETMGANPAVLPTLSA